MLTRITRLFAAPPARKKTPRTRLSVEALEDRAVPTAFTAATVADLIADINAANLNSEADTITLSAGATFSLIAANNTTDGGNGLPVLTARENLTIIGSGDIIERAAGAPAFRLLDVAVDASLTLQKLTLQGGVATRGGAVFNQGNLTLQDVTVLGNTAQGPAGGPSWGGFTSPGGGAAGGGIYSDGTLVMEGCTVRNNAAIGGHGGDRYTYYSVGENGYPVKVVLPGSDGGDGVGGGIYVAGGMAEVTNSTVTGNSASGGAGGSNGGHKGHGYGGGLYIDPAASVFLDAFSVGRAKQNKASTSDNDISGIYTVI
jgi:hypothetical protein